MLLVFIAFSVFFVQISADSLEDNENDEEIPSSEDKWFKEHKVEIFDVNFLDFITVEISKSRKDVVRWRTRDSLSHVSK